jgi:hypothetical protein
MDVMGTGALSWIRSSGFIAEGWPAQDNKVITQTKYIIRHLQFFMRIMLIKNLLL